LRQSALPSRSRSDRYPGRNALCTFQLRPVTGSWSGRGQSGGGPKGPWGVRSQQNRL